MRQHSDRLVDVLSGSFERELTVNVFNGSDRVLEGARFESWQLDSDLGAAIVSGGSGVVVCAPSDGVSLSPVGMAGVLSAFRARVELVLTVRAGGFSESVSLGMFRVLQNPSAQDFTATMPDGRVLVTGSRVGVKFASLDVDVDRRGFAFPEQSLEGVSAFGEIRRFTGMPVEETVPDVVVPALKVWEAKQGGRLEAVHELGRLLGGTAVVNSRGAWQIIPDTAGDPDLVLQLGDQGSVFRVVNKTVVEVTDEIDTETVYNEVIGSFEDAAGVPFYSEARVLSGPLSVDGDYGVHTRYYSSDLVKTQEQGDAAVQSVLDQSISSQQYDVKIQCHVNPLVEVGDVVELAGWKRPLSGVVQKVSLSDGPLMNCTLRVQRGLL